MNICRVEAELLHAGGRTDRPRNMTKLIAAFRNFANAPSDILNFLKCPFLQTLYLCVNLVYTWGRHECFINGRFLCFR